MRTNFHANRSTGAIFFSLFENFKNNKQISRGIKFSAVIFRAFAGTNFAGKLIFCDFAELFFAACQENQYFYVFSSRFWGLYITLKN